MSVVTPPLPIAPQCDAPLALSPRPDVAEATIPRTAESCQAAAIATLLERTQPWTIARPVAEIRADIADYRVLTDATGAVVATVAMLPVGEREAELRSLAVDPDVRGGKLGARLVRDVLWRAALAMRRVRCVTACPEFFARFGFRELPGEEAPRRGSRSTSIAGRARVVMLAPTPQALTEGLFSTPVSA